MSAKKKKAAPSKPAPKKATAKKATAKKATAKKATAKKATAKKSIVRRDGSGHLNAQYAADLRRRSKSTTVDSDARAFLRGKRKNDALADELGKEFLETVTSGEDEGNEIRDAVVEEEMGGPFVRTRARQEFGYARDASNPKGSRREPFPKT